MELIFAKRKNFFGLFRIIINYIKYVIICSKMLKFDKYLIKTYFMKKTPFVDSLLREEKISINGQSIDLAYYNLLITIRDVSLFCRGIKPTRTWKLQNVKIYFGLQGSKDKILLQLIALRDLYNDHKN